ncbi:MAG: DNA-3-methyladenine glycosylase 2 family protein [Sphingobacteriales bacterium]|nr:MAG: DNA-3-methyladenine glycosylase 2 family protein [Sphingobacteriales bacterium]
MLESITYLSNIDEKLKAVLDTFGMPAFPRREQGFAAMCHIILEQQVSISSAKATYRKIEDFMGKPTPASVLETANEDFRAMGVSRQKTAYLKDLAEKVASGYLDFSTFPSKQPDQIASELLAVKGVGNWSVEVYLMFCMQHQDILPLGDIAIRHAIREIYGIVDLDGMAELGKQWAPHRTMASFILWHHYLTTRNRKDYL